MTLKTNNFEGQTANDPITTGTSGASGTAFDLVSASGVTYNATIFKNGSRAAALAATVTTYMEWQDTANTAFSVGCWFYMDAAPSTAVQGPVLVRSSGDLTVVRIQMATNRTLSVQGSVQIGSASAALTAGAWYYLDFYAPATSTTVASQITCDIYDAAGTLVSTIGGSGTVSNGVPARVNFGQRSSATWTTRYDDLRANIGSGTANGFPVSSTPATAAPAVVAGTTTVGTPTIQTSSQPVLTTVAAPSQVLSPTITAPSNTTPTPTRVNAITAITNATVVAPASAVVTPTRVNATTVVPALVAQVSAVMFPDFFVTGLMIQAPTVIGAISVTVHPLTVNRPARIETPTIVIPGMPRVVTPVRVNATTNIGSPFVPLGQQTSPIRVLRTVSIQYPTVIIGLYAATFFEWNGSTEIQLTVQGVWNGTIVAPATSVEVIN